MTVVFEGHEPRLESQKRGSALSPAEAAPAQPRFGEGYVWDSWYVAGLTDALVPGAREARRILGLPVLIGRTRAGAAFALRDRCAHRAVPLSRGHAYIEQDGSESIECPYHGWRFGSDGSCSAIPSSPGQTGEPDFAGARVRVPAYPIIEQQGLIWIWMGRDAAAPPLDTPPLIPGVVGRRPLIVDQLDYEVHVDHAILGLIDPAHGPYVHQQWWWRTKASQHRKRKSFRPSTLGFTMERHPPSANSRAYRLLGGAPTTEIVFRLPGLRWEHVQIGPRTVLALSAMTPIDARTTRMHQIIWSDHGLVRALRPILRLGARAFLRQDGRIIAAQSEGLMDNPPLLWVGDADQQARWYAQLKREWQACRALERAFQNPVKGRVLEWNS